MCKFFSLVTKGDGELIYFNSELRKKIRNGELKYEPDSHSSIIEYFLGKQSLVAHFHNGDLEASCNKYEYNPLTQKLNIDSLNTVNDSAEVMEKLKALDFKTVVPELILKPIVNPFDIEVDEATEADIELLKQWASVRDSAWASVGDSVWDSVGDSVGDSARVSVWASVGASVWASVGDSVGDSARASVWDSVRDSVWDYISSFFCLENWGCIDHEPFVNPFQSGITLWGKGLVPSYDGEIWRLHAKKNGTVQMLWGGEI